MTGLLTDEEVETLRKEIIARKGQICDLEHGPEEKHSIYRGWKRLREKCNPDNLSVYNTAKKRYDVLEAEEFIDAALMIDRSKCQICGYTLCLQIHHLDRDRSNNTARNLSCLCMNCHFTIHRHRKSIEEVRGKYKEWYAVEEIRVRES